MMGLFSPNDRIYGARSSGVSPPSNFIKIKDLTKCALCDINIAIMDNCIYGLIKKKESPVFLFSTITRVYRKLHASFFFKYIYI